MARILYNDDWFEEIASHGHYEAEFEAILQHEAPQSSHVVSASHSFTDSSQCTRQPTCRCGRMRRCCCTMTDGRQNGRGSTPGRRFSYTRFEATA